MPTKQRPIDVKKQLKAHDRIVGWKVKKRYKQREISQFLGLSQSVVSNAINYYVSISMDTADTILKLKEPKQ